MCRQQEFYFDSANGFSRIYVRQWLPEGEPRGVVQLTHGINEHIGRYADFAAFLAKNGFVVVGNDHAGHGKSWEKPEDEGFFADKDGWMCIVEDMRTLQQQTRAQYPGLPYVLLGHSMGSFAARTFAIWYPGAVNGLILSGTGQQPAAMIGSGLAFLNLLIRCYGPRHRGKAASTLCFGSYNKNFKEDHCGSAWLTRDAEIREQHKQDKACHFVPTVSLYRDMLWGIRYLSDSKNVAKMDLATPVFFFAGDMDPVGEEGRGVRRAVQAFVDAGCQDVSVKLYPDGRHEMLNEINRDEVYQDVLDWLEEKI